MKKRRTPREPAEMLPEDTATALWEPRKPRCPYAARGMRCDCLACAKRRAGRAKKQ